MTKKPSTKKPSAFHLVIPESMPAELAELYVPAYEALKAELSAYETPSDPSSSIVDAKSGDIADQGAVSFQAFNNNALRSHFLRRLNAVRLALQRLEDGTWGMCEQCGINWIPSGRMKALGFVAVTCQDCAGCKSQEG